MKLNFMKVNPTENMTVFITDPLPRKSYRHIAKDIMNYNRLHGEQVGFIEKPTCNYSQAVIRLHMMGDEFCANATRGLAAALVYKQYPNIEKTGEKFIVPLEVSGAEELIYCEVEAMEKKEKFISTATIPLHKNLEMFSVDFEDKTYDGTLVTFHGIIHFIVNSDGLENKEAFFKVVKNQLKDLDFEALGIMFYDEANSYMEPLVYVKATDSLFWERGCGSGTAAVGVALSTRLNKAIDIAVKQPGGDLQVSTTWQDNKITNISLSGPVEIAAEGSVYI
ncbi:diaminopimelate epimerase [Natronincola ferrireducens]|uniref:Diaminopimelate epimerase n=1 Tax=Natronincola ferrireducens TaxID=393762 RepID=A0A1G8YYL2_9FIRM|nr:hypothetical protein [Natronincola ferrireducens]SDK07861.1 Diaminopimelate epimerase [Natronincola ferrireducens]